MKTRFHASKFHFLTAGCRRAAFALLLAAAPLAVRADTTNIAYTPVTLPALPDAGLSLFRVTGALALVIGIFLGGAWLYRNWQRVVRPRAQQPKLNVLECRSLGGKHALYVVAYEHERFLLAASPNGVSLVSALVPADPEADSDRSPATPPPSFAQSLAQVLRSKPVQGRNPNVL